MEQRRRQLRIFRESRRGFGQFPPAPLSQRLWFDDRNRLRIVVQTRISTISMPADGGAPLLPDRARQPLLDPDTSEPGLCR